MAKSRLCILAATIAAGAMLSTQAHASAMEMIKEMDPSAPKYNEPQCKEVRDGATRQPGVGVPIVVYQRSSGGGGGGVPAGAAVAFGGIALIMAVEAAREAERADAVFAEIIIERCGEDAFIPYFRTRAEKNDADAAAWLGRTYERKQDWPQAVHWYQVGADRKNASAELGLGTMYANGTGVTQDRAQAEALWLRAADHGSITAMTKLGDLYAQDQNHAKAGAMYRKAAERSAAAAFHLAEMYEQGQGVERSDTAAYGWFCMASIMGSTEANARRDAVAARLSRRDAEDTARMVEKCYFYHRCNF